VDITRAFSYIFEDEEWVAKLAISAVISFLAIITTPLLVGLALWAALLGYLADLVRNLRDGHPTPLPRWDNYGDKIGAGANILAAGILYGLPNALASACIATTASSWGDGFFGSGIAFAFICCVTPLLILYNLITWPMWWLALARFAEDRRIGVFFQFGDLLGTLRRSLGTTLQWMLAYLLVSFGLGLLGAIPCAGWAGAPALAIPVLGHLLAQFSNAVDGAVEKPKNRAGF
jgi:hypothetical protein